ncbi:hypothetical protein EDB92DRAFT_1365382 [Lactarius akahatsu]|uniref:Uncharacterized protein n=1 Tax=Lactarius akahatsu TaxID=416441 RepID=A0AAD4QAG9_9AGAM|nr:hypothetical protein EDB92DRAFT_1365382 [Lactarius akahatsu]
MGGRGEESPGVCMRVDDGTGEAQCCKPRALRQIDSYNLSYTIYFHPGAPTVLSPHLALAFPSFLPSFPCFTFIGPPHALSSSYLSRLISRLDQALPLVPLGDNPNLSPPVRTPRDPDLGHFAWLSLQDHDLVPANAHQLTITPFLRLCIRSIWASPNTPPYIYANSDGYVVLITLPARGSEPYNPQRGPRKGLWSINCVRCPASIRLSK